MIAIKDIAKIRKDVMDEFVAQWRMSEERWKISSERVRNLNRLADMLEQLSLLDYLLDLRLSLSQIAFLNDLSKKELKEAILFDGNGIGLDPEDLKDRSRVRRQLRLFDETGEDRLSLTQNEGRSDMTKRVYIWESVEPVSRAWHSDGGLVVVCEDGAFEETIRKHYGDILADPEISSWDPSRLDQDSIDALVQEVLGTAPTRILELSDTETTNPFVIVFPDAGCC